MVNEKKCANWLLKDFSCTFFDLSQKVWQLTERFLNISLLCEWIRFQFAIIFIHCTHYMSSTSTNSCFQYCSWKGFCGQLGWIFTLLKLEYEILSHNKKGKFSCVDSQKVARHNHGIQYAILFSSWSTLVCWFPFLDSCFW